MAGIKQPLQDILTKLATLDVTDQNGRTVKLYARVWNNQVDFEKEGELYNYPKPAAFVEMVSPMVFEEIGLNFRSVDLGIIIHLVHEYYNGEGTFEQDLAIFDLRDQVIALLSQYQPAACGPMVAVNEAQEFDHDNLYHYQITFAANFTDSKASPYDVGRGIYIDKEPPTGLQMEVEKGDGPIFPTVKSTFKIPR